MEIIHTHLETITKVYSLLNHSFYIYLFIYLFIFHLFFLISHFIFIFHCAYKICLSQIIPARVLFCPLLSYCTTVKHQISDSVNAAQDDIDEDASIKQQDSFNEVLDETLIAILGKLDTQDAKDAAEAILTV